MKILLVDDHALFRDGMRYVLQQLGDSITILQAGNFLDGVTLASEHPDLDLALLDLNMPGSEGTVSVQFFHGRFPHIPVVVVSGEEGRGIMEKVMHHGAMGFISKNSSAQTMLSALNMVLDGGVYIPPQLLQQYHASADEAQPRDRRIRRNEQGLSDRQVEVLKLIVAGLSNKEIAGCLALAEGTVKIHVASVFHALGVNSRLDAAKMAKTMNLLKDGQ